MHFPRLWFVCLVGLISLLSTPVPARCGEAEEEEVNTGQDITRPLTRFDIRYKFQNAPGSRNDDIHTVTLRVDKPFELSPTWKIATRFDLPLTATNIPSRDNPGGSMHYGVSDVLAQALVVHTPTENFAWAAGAELIFPTASEDSMGTGRYQIGPLAAARWKTDTMLKGSWFALAGRWDRDFAKVTPDSTPTNELQFAPIVYFPLPNQFFINLFPSLDIKYNLGKKRPQDEGRWFVPANVMVGKMLRRNVVSSIEVGVPIINDYKFYDFKVEARIGILF